MKVNPKITRLTLLIVGILFYLQSNGQICNPIPSVSVVPDVNTICEGNNINFTISRTDYTYVPGQSWNFTIYIGAEAYTYKAITTTSYRFSIPVNQSGTVGYMVSVVDTYRGCENPIAFGSNIMVIAKSTVTNIPANYTICTGQQTTPVNFTGQANSFQWEVISNPGNVTGLPSGVQTGNFGSYTLNNNLTTPVTVVIRVTPVSSVSGNNCPGTAQTFSITVNPMPVISNAMPNLTVCSGTTIAAEAIQGTADYYNFVLTGDPVLGTISGSVPSGGSIGPYTPVNNGTVPLTVNVSITPANSVCTGTTRSFTITVYPPPSIRLTSALNSDAQEVCLFSDIENITYQVNTATGITVNGLVSALLDTYNNGVVTIYGAPRDRAGDTIFYSITTTGHYAACEPAMAEGFIKVNPLPTAEISGAADICVGATHQLTGSPAGGVWQSSNPNIASVNSSTGVVTGVSTGYVTITYLYTNNENCPDQATVSFNVITPPSLILSSGYDNQEICEGASIQTIVYTHSTGVQGATVSGLPAGVSFTASGNTITINGTPTQSGEFDYTVTVPASATCTTVSVKGAITVEAQPTITLVSAAETQSQTVCYNTNITNIEYLISGGATNTVVYGLPNNVSSYFNAATGILTISGAPETVGNFNYDIQAWANDWACSDVRADGTITVTALPYINYIQDISICDGTTADLRTAVQVSSDNSLLFFTDAEATNPVNNPEAVAGITSTTTFYVKAAGSATGCISEVRSFNVRVTESPSITANDVTICPGAAISLVNAVSESNGNGLSFYTDAAGTIPVDNPYYVTGIITTTIFYVKAHNYGTGCDSPLIPFTVFVNAGSEITLTSSTGTDAQSNCFGESITNITYNITGAASVNVSGLPNNVNYVYNAGTLTISGTPSNYGTFNYTITVQGNDASCSPVTETGTVTVNPKPSAAFTPTTDGPLYIHFNDESIIPTGQIVEWLWDFGDGDTATGKDQHHHYDTGGSYLVTLIVVSDKGCSDTISLDIISGPTIQAGFNVSSLQQCFNGNSFVFTNTSTVQDGTNITYLWEFGDGQTSTEVNPTHSYTSSGLYTIRLSVSSAGVTQKASKTVIVVPTPSINVSNLPVCSGGTVNLSDAVRTSINTSARFYTNAAGTNPVSNTVISGITTTTTYYVKVVDLVTRCESELKPVQVIVNPLPVVNVQPISICYGNTLNLTQAIISSTGDLTFYSDSLGTVKIPSPSNINGLTTSTQYYVKAVNSTTGCESALKKINVKVNPLPDFTANEISVCPGTTIDLTTAIPDYATGIYTFYADQIESAEITNPQAVPIINRITTFYVKKKDNNTGCESLLQSFNVAVSSAPVFTANDIEICQGATVDLTNSVGSSSTGTIYYFYSDAAGNNPITNTTISGLNATTKYYVKSVYSISGCESELQDFDVIVNPLPTVTVQQLEVCKGEIFDLTAAIVNIPANSTLQYYYDAAGTSRIISPTAMPAIDKTTDYYVKAINTVTGCQSPLTLIAVVPNNLPTVLIYNISACIGETVDLTVGVGVLPGNNILYYTDAAGMIPVANPAAVTGLTVSTTFYVRVVDSNTGCESNLTPLVVTLNPLPVIVVQDITICPNTMADLTTAVNVPSGSSAMFYTDAAGTLPVQFPAAVDGITVTTTYYVKAVNGNTGCESSLVAFDVIINNLPDYTVSNITTCAREPVDLRDAVTGSGISYTFYTDASGNNIVQPQIAGLTAATTFYVRIIDNLTGCVCNLQSFTVNVNPLPVISVQNISIYTGEEVDLRTAIISSNSGNYSFYRDEAGTQLVNNPEALTGVLSTTTFWVKASYDATGCSSLLVPFEVVVNEVPVIILISNPGTDNQVVCNEIMIDTIRYFTANTMGVTITGLPPGMGYTYRNDTITIAGTPSQFGTFEYTITAYSRLIDYVSPSVTGTIQINPAPAAAFTYEVNTSNQLNVQFTDNTVRNEVVESWVWAFGDGQTSTLENPSHTYSAIGKYEVSLTITTVNGCLSTISDTLSTDFSIQAAFTVNDPVECLDGNFITFINESIVTGAPVDYYLWEFGDGTTSNLENPTHTYSSIGNFPVKLKVVTALAEQFTSRTVTLLPKAYLDLKDLTICSGESVDLQEAVVGRPSGSMAVFYSDPSATNQISNIVAPSTTTTYYVRSLYQVGNCYGEIEAFTVIVNVPPTLSVNSSINFCEGEYADLTQAVISASPGAILKYYADINGHLVELLNPSSISVPAQPNPSFYVQAVNTTTGCTSQLEEVMLIVNEKPVVTVVDIEICVGETVDLTTAINSFTGTSYVFYTDAAGTISSPSLISGLTQNTTFYARSLDSNTGCVGEIQSFNVVVNPLPDAPITYNLTICSAANVDLTRAVNLLPGRNIVFYADPLGMNPIPNPYSYLVSATTDFWVKAVFATGCESGLVGFTVTVDATPASPTVQDITICNGQTADLTTAVIIPAGFIPQFYMDAAGRIPFENPDEVVGITATSTFYVKLVDSYSGLSCETALVPFKVIVNSTPSISVNNINICAGSAADLTQAVVISTGNVLAFYVDTLAIIPVTNPTSVNNITTNTTYYVQSVDSITSCVSELLSFEVLVNSIPNIIVDDLAICLSQPVDLTAAVLSSTNGSPVFYWDSSATQPITNSTNLNTIRTDTVIYVRAENRITGCLSPVTSFTVRVNSFGDIIVQNITICSGSTANLNNAVVNPNLYPLEFYSDKNGTQLIQTPENVSIVNTIQTFYVKAIDDTLNCSSILVPFNVIVENPVEVVAGDITICRGETVDLWDGVLVTAGSIPLFYTDSAGTNPVPTPTAVTNLVNTTVFYVKAQSAMGCESDLIPLTVTVNPLPNLMVQDITVCQGADVDLRAAVLNPAGYILTYYRDAAGTQVIPNPESVSGINVPTVIYVRASDNQSGCEGTIMSFTVRQSLPTTLNLTNKTVDYNGQQQYIDSVFVQSNGANVGSESWVDYEYYDINNQLLTTLPVNAGTYRVIAIFEGNNNYCAVESNEALLTINKIPQTIIFDLVDTVYVNTPPFTLTATASSGLPVNYISTNRTVATVSGDVLTVQDVGVTTIIASQAGDINYLRANNVTRVLVVVPLSYITVQDISVCPGFDVDLTTAVNNPAGYTLSFYYDAAGTQVITNPESVSGITTATPFYVKAADLSTAFEGPLLSFTVNLGRAVTIVLADKTVDYNGLPQTIDSVYINYNGTNVGDKSWIQYEYYDENNQLLQNLPVEPGVYTVIGIFNGNIQYCAAQSNTSVLTILPVGIISITVTPTEADIRVGESIQLVETIHPADVIDKRVTWSSSDPSIATVDENGLVRGLRYGTVIITVTTIDGNHSASSVIHVHIYDDDNDIYIPDGFSPDGDGNNDYFVVDGLEKYPNNRFYVFDRGGKLHYNVKGYKNDWDGTANVGPYTGRKIPPGTYYFMLWIDGRKVERRFIVIKY